VSKPTKIGIAGLGTVGVGTFKLLKANSQVIAERCGRQLVVSAVSASHRKKDRGLDFRDVAWFDDGATLAAEADVDIVVEVIGGAEGSARETVEAALTRKLHVVTANKALIANHGIELAKMAEGSGVSLAYEAAVAGGVPIIKALREGLASNSINKITGILNGTCNYIISTMRMTGRDFDDVLEEAQTLGYAEADPTFDVDGIDTANKLAILASVAFGTVIDINAVHVEGIRNISTLDIQYADEFGYRIKLLGLAERLAECDDGGIVQRVYPCLIRPDHPLASVEGVFNAVVAEGDFVGKSIYEGRGAGAGPTASAIVSDIMDIAAGRHAPVFGVPVHYLKTPRSVPVEQHVGEYYVRLLVVDRPGVFADIASAFRDEDVSMESVLQRGRNENANVNVVIITHETLEANLLRALKRVQTNAALVELPHMMRIESLGTA
jgi:homoserine dehydrogenase